MLRRDLPVLEPITLSPERTGDVIAIVAQYMLAFEKSGSPFEATRCGHAIAARLAEAR